MSISSNRRRWVLCGLFAVGLTGCGQARHHPPPGRTLDETHSRAVLQMVSFSRQARLLWLVGLRLEEHAGRIADLRPSGRARMDTMASFSRLRTEYALQSRQLAEERQALLDLIAVLARMDRSNRRKAAARLREVNAANRSMLKAIERVSRTAVEIERSGHRPEGFERAERVVDPIRRKRESRFAAYMTGA